MYGQSFSVMASTKKLCLEEIEIFLESDSDTYSEDEGEEMLEDNLQLPLA
jgi:hypothetical protein